MKRAFLGKTVLILIVSILLTLGLGACSQALDSLNTAAETALGTLNLAMTHPLHALLVGDTT